MKAAGEKMTAEETRTWKRRQQIDYLNGEMQRIEDSIAQQNKVRRRSLGRSWGRGRGNQAHVGLVSPHRAAGRGRHPRRFSSSTASD